MAAATQQAGIQPYKMGLSVRAYQLEQARHLAWGALRSSTSAGSRKAIVISGKSWIIPTHLPIESSEFSELLKEQLTVQVGADPTITGIESMAAALNGCDIPMMISEVEVRLVIVCSPFEAVHEHPTMVNVWADPEKFELTRALANNLEFTVLDIRKPLSPRPLRMEVPLVTSLGHYLATTDCPGGIIIDSVIPGHVFGDEELVKDVKFYANPRMVRFHNDTILLIVGVGSVETETLRIPHVEYAPGLKVNLVSMNQLGCDHALLCCFNAKKMEIKMDNGIVTGAGTGEDGIYVLQHLKVPQPEEEKPSQLIPEEDLVYVHS
ncbi:hypothetical protein ACP4OV_001977 [Aristida adscensionis]